MVDVVVRDKNGRPVTDLARDDFEIYEDGVRQDVSVLEVIASEPTSGSALVTAGKSSATARPIPPPAVASAAPPKPAVIALVFDRLSPDARDLAHQAALTYVDEMRDTQDFTGVFTIDVSLNTVQAYTRDAALVRNAVDRAARTASASFTQSNNAMEQAQAARQIVYGNPVSGQIAAPDAARSAVGGRPPAPDNMVKPDPNTDLAERALAQMLVRMDEAFAGLDRDIQGYATTNALLAVVHSLQGMPGRKTLILLSEGLMLPPNVEHYFRSVIETANRANVAIYAIDAAGLRAHSKAADTRVEMAEEITKIEMSRDAGIMTKGLERSEELLRMNPESNLGQLADQTGGLLIQNTNDLRSGMRRINSDRHFYYLLGYSPRNDQLDGRYREISVKVRRSGVEVHARKGYRANPPTSMPVLSYEGPALALLDGATVPNAFPVRAGALSFPEPKRPGLTPIVVQVAESSVTFREEKDKKRYTADVSVVARIKDANDKIVRKLSQRYELGGPIAQLDAAKRSEILFYREPELTPGVYTLEAVVYDAIAQKASARLATIEVPRVDPGTLRMSTLMIVRRSERLSADERNAVNPLFFGDVVLYPNLGEPLHKGTDKEVAFAATIYPPAGAAAPAAVLELLQNGQRVGQAAVQLPAPDATGRIQYVGRLPIDNFTPGNYELRLTVGDGAARQIRSGLFTIAQ